MKKKRIVLILIVISICIALLFDLLVKFRNHIEEDRNQQNIRVERFLKDELQIPFTPTMRLENSDYDRGIDPIVFAKISIGIEDVEAFIEGFHASEWSESKQSISVRNSPKWWLSKNPTKFKSLDSDTMNSEEKPNMTSGECLRVLIDLSEAETVQIYIKWFDAW